MTILRGFFIFWSQFGCFLHPSAWGLPHNKAMMAGFTPAVAFFPCYDKIKQRTTPKVAAPKVSKGRSESPLVASAEAKSLRFGKSHLQ